MVCLYHLSVATAALDIAVLTYGELLLQINNVIMYRTAIDVMLLKGFLSHST